MIPSDDDTSWVSRGSQIERTDEPLGDYGALIRAMLEVGVTERQIARFAKIIGYETAFQIAYHLGDSQASYENFPEPLERVRWGLFTVDEYLQPVEGMYGLHESMLSGDPSGLEMRPPPEEA